MAIELSKLDIKLLRAVDNKDFKKARIALKAGANPNSHCERKVTSLHRAAWQGCLDITRLLVEYGADVNAKESLTGKTPLYHAYNIEIIKLLIKEGSDVNVRDTYDNNTILHSLSFNEEILSIYMNAGFDIHAKNRMGFNILHLQAAYGNTYIVKELVKYGADVSSNSDNGKTAKELALYYESHECYSLLETYEIRNSLLKNNTNPSNGGIGL